VKKGLGFYEFASDRVKIMIKEILGIHRIDARKIGDLIKEPIVDVTITSPPYFDLKDYGYKEQIGYGQTYEQYLEDLNIVFKNVYDCTKETGTLWVIIDAFRKDGEVVPLPFDFSNKIRNIGWKLQEVIIWGKDRTVPWTHKGQMRNLFEYILMFSKTDKFNFYIDEIRDFETLKKWWVRYPERYNPKGKTPNAIWNFDIPTQGSWGNGYIKHFCPLPEEMIAQILKLTTKENDVALDPFAGSGAVLSKAHNMKREYLGFELNQEYIDMFTDYLSKTGEKKRKEYELEQKNQYGQNDFQKIILQLRVLKYARTLYKQLTKLGYENITRIYVELTSKKPQNSFGLVVAKYCILIKSSKKKEQFSSVLREIVSKPPLSKFGVESNIHITSNYDEFISEINLFLQ
jgi:DNA modification methylase